MERIIVIGCTGSGKSTFCKKLNKITNLPLIHLDLLYWNEDMTRVSDSEFESRLNKALEANKYIIDGDYIKTLDSRIKASDTIIFLDYNVRLALRGVRKRTGRKRSDLPFIETRLVHPKGFYKHIKNYRENERPIILELLNKYDDKLSYVFKNRKEANGFLNHLRHEKKINISFVV